MPASTTSRAARRRVAPRGAVAPRAGPSRRARATAPCAVDDERRGATAGRDVVNITTTSSTPSSSSGDMAPALWAPGPSSLVACYPVPPPLRTAHPFRRQSAEQTLLSRPLYVPSCVFSRSSYLHIPNPKQPWCGCLMNLATNPPTRLMVRGCPLLESSISALRRPPSGSILLLFYFPSLFVRRRSRHPLSEKARDGGHPGGTANF